MIYVGVTDVAEALKKAEALGGTTIVPRCDGAPRMRRRGRCMNHPSLIATQFVPGASSMRLPYISPQSLNAAQRPLYDDMKAGAAAKYQTFEIMRDDGALFGPWSAWLYEPELGSALWGLSKAMTRFKHLPELPRQVAILVVGARFKAGYEIYAHSVVGRSAGLQEHELTAILKGIRPDGLSIEAETAYDVASALLGGGILDTALYGRSLEIFGQQGTSELIYLVGYYCLVSMTLNGFDVPVPGAIEPV